MRAVFHACAFGFVLAGCMASKDAAFELGGDTGSAIDGDTGFQPADTASDESPEPVWWSIDGQVPVQGANPVVEGASLTFSVYPAEGREGGNLCATQVPAVSVAAEPAPEAAVYAWWLLDLGIGDGACDALGVAFPGSLHIGVGELDPNIVAVLGDAGYSDLEANLYGAYVSIEPDGELWVYGVAGTADNYGGEAPSDALPIPDGVWEIRGIYLLPL